MLEDVDVTGLRRAPRITLAKSRHPLKEKGEWRERSVEGYSQGGLVRQVGGGASRVCILVESSPVVSGSNTLFAWDLVAGFTMLFADDVTGLRGCATLVAALRHCESTAMGTTLKRSFLM